MSHDGSATIAVIGVPGPSRDTAKIAKTVSHSSKSKSSATSTASPLASEPVSNGVVQALLQLDAAHAAAAVRMRSQSGVTPLFSDPVIANIFLIHRQHQEAFTVVKQQSGVVPLVSRADLDLAAQVQGISNLHQQFLRVSTSTHLLDGNTPLLSEQSSPSDLDSDEDTYRAREHASRVRHTSAPQLPDVDRLMCSCAREAQDEDRDSFGSAVISPSCFSPSAYSRDYRPDEGNAVVTKRLWKYRQLEFYDRPALSL